MWKKNDNKIRLEKKVSKREEMEKWIDNHAYLFICIGMLVIIILLVVICFKFAPGTESGNWYNNRTGIKMINFDLFKMLWSVI